MYITATRYIAYHQRIHRIHHNLRQRNADCRSNSDHIKVSIKIQFANFFHAIAKYFDVSTDYLLGKTNTKRIQREERIGVFSKRLKRVRELKGISQRQAAEDLNISPQNLSYYENGRDAGYDLLIRMARYYNVTVEYLIGASPVMQRENIDINKDIGLNDKTINLLRQRNKWGYSEAADIVNEVVGLSLIHI